MQKFYHFVWFYKDNILNSKISFDVTDAQANSGECVRLASNTSEKINLQDIKTAHDCIQAAANPDIVSDVEELATVWCKQIEQVR